MSNTTTTIISCGFRPNFAVVIYNLRESILVEAFIGGTAVYRWYAPNGEFHYDFSGNNDLLGQLRFTEIGFTFKLPPLASGHSGLKAYYYCF